MLRSADAARDDTLEWSVWAQCPPHLQVMVPQQIQIRVAFSSTPSGPSATGWITAFGESRFDTTTQKAYWETPEKGWVAFVFEGPPVSGTFYCQTDWGNKSLHLSYVPHPKLKVLLSPNGQPTSTELDHSVEANRTTFLVPPTPGSTTYRAGTGSAAPYWLECAIPVYDVQSSSTTLFPEFR